MSSDAAKTCLKCGYARRPQDVGAAESCPSCGAIYAKVEAALRGSGEPAAAYKPAVVGAIPYVPEYVDNERRRLAQLVYLLYLLPTGITTLLGFWLIHTARDDHRDEIASAHYEWQINTVARLAYAIVALLLLALVLGAAQGGYWLTHDESLHSFARKGGLFLLLLWGTAYLWIFLRTLRGWLQLLRAEGP